MVWRHLVAKENFHENRFFQFILKVNLCSFQPNYSHLVEKTKVILVKHFWAVQLFFHVQKNKCMNFPFRTTLNFIRLRISGDFMHKKTVYSTVDQTHFIETKISLKMSRGNIIFPKRFILRTVFLTSMLFVLVLFLFSISKIFHVLVLFLFENKNKDANMFSNN